MRRTSAWGKARTMASPRAWSFSDKERTSFQKDREKQKIVEQGMIEQDITKRQRAQEGEKPGRAEAPPGDLSHLCHSEERSNVGIRLSLDEKNGLPRRALPSSQ